MKKTIHDLSLSVIAIVIPAVLFTACFEFEFLDQITYDGNKYEIVGGIIENFGIEKEDPVSYRMGLTLYSDGLFYFRSIEEFSGEGAILYINMYSSSSSDLAPGTYVFNQTSRNSLTFDGGVFIENISFSMANPDGFNAKNALAAGDAIKSGTLKLTMDDQFHRITFSGKTRSDKNLKATFRGELPIIDKQAYR